MIVFPAMEAGKTSENGLAGSADTRRMMSSWCTRCNARSSDPAVGEHSVCDGSSPTVFCFCVRSEYRSRTDRFDDNALPSSIV